jgi:hypothetical protein
MLLIGSKALEIVAPNLKTRNAVDYDLIATHEEFQQFVKLVGFDTVIPQKGGSKITCTKANLPPVEVEIAWENTSAELLLNLVDAGEQIWMEQLKCFVKVAPLHVLFALKASHRFKKNSSHFHKTRADYFLLKNAGCQITEDIKQFYDLREKETYDYSHPNLDTSKGSFFDPNQVEYIYDHDSIHLAIAYPLPPAYKLFQGNKAEVKCSRDMFEDLPLETKLRSVLEESYVLALERSQIPFPGKLTPKESFLIALKKVCTSISSGWWRAFAYEHYDDVVALYSDMYVAKFAYGLRDGIVTLSETPELVAV